MLTHVHVLVYTLWCSVGFGAFWENEVHNFYCTGGKFGEVVGVFLAEKHSPDASPEAPDVALVRPVCRQPGSVRVRHRTLGTGRNLERPVV